MINLFEFAKKELSQDAFLLWILSNANNRNQNKEEKAAHDAAVDLISFLTGKRDFTIEKVTLDPQWNHIDIVAEVMLIDGSVFNIFIEDKTTSKEHSNQLAEYNSDIDSSKKYAAAENYKLFYKTDLIDTEERQRVMNAGWTIIELKAIAGFWAKYLDSDNLVISMYAHRVMDIYDALQTSSLPSKIDDREIEMLTWKGFFINRIMPVIAPDCTAYVVKTSYKYEALIIKPKSVDKNTNCPYLEIRDRDCAGGKFKALLLTYGMAESKQRCKEFEPILKANAGIPGTLFKKGKDNCRKQVLTMNPVKVKNADDFEKQMKNALDTYLKIMNMI